MIGPWKDPSMANQDDLRMAIDMSQSIVIFTKEDGLKVSSIEEIL